MKKILYLIPILLILFYVSPALSTECNPLYLCGASGYDMSYYLSTTLSCATNYNLMSTLGYIYSDQVSGTNPLYLCGASGYDMSYYLSTTLSCAANYNLMSTLGYIYSDQVSGTNPLYLCVASGYDMSYYLSTTLSCAANYNLMSTLGYVYLDLTSCEDSLIPTECTDPDGGLNAYYIKGTTTGAYWNDPENIVVLTDTCLLDYNPVDSCSGDNCYLNEYGCTPSGPMEVAYDCPNDCLDGACVGGAPAGPVDCSTINCADYETDTTCINTQCCDWDPIDGCIPSDPEALYCNLNGNKHYLEDCDGTAFGYQADGTTPITDCVDLDSTLYTGGTLSCTDFCTFDTSQCLTGEACDDIFECSAYSTTSCLADECAVGPCYVADDTCTLCSFDFCLDQYSIQENCDDNPCNIQPGCFWDLEDPEDPDSGYCSEIESDITDQDTGIVYDCYGQSWGPCIDGVRTTSGECTGADGSQQQLTVSCRVTKKFPFFSSKGIIIVLALLVGYYLFINLDKKKK